MGAFSHIAWTDATWNVASGCTKVSPGCKFCYAKHQSWPRLSSAPGNAYTGRPFEDVQFHLERLDTPVRWQRPRKIFVNSLSDLFHEDLTDDQIATTFIAMAMADRHIFQILTKRAERAAQWFATHDFKACLEAFDRVVPKTLLESSSALRIGRQKIRHHNWPLENVWMGISAEDQVHYDLRLPHLLKMPAAVRWISAEPLLGSLDLRLEQLATNSVNWVVVGGESGWTCRPMHPLWAMSLRDQCADHRVSYFFKQWGGHFPMADLDSTPEQHIEEACGRYRGVVLDINGQVWRLPDEKTDLQAIPALGPKPWLMKQVHRGASKDHSLESELHQAYPRVPDHLIPALTESHKQAKRGRPLSLAQSLSRRP